MNTKSQNKRITLRMTDEVYKHLLDSITISGRSMNAEINMRLLKSFTSLETIKDKKTDTEKIRDIIQKVIHDEFKIMEISQNNFLEQIKNIKD